MKRLLLVTAMCVLAYPPRAGAQENTLWPHLDRTSATDYPRWFVGLEGGVRYDQFTATAFGSSPGSIGRLLATADGLGPSVSAYVDVGLFESFGFQLSLRWDRRVVGGSGTTSADCIQSIGVLFPPVLLDTVPISSDFTLKQGFVSVGIATRIGLNDALSVVIGPTFDIPVGDGSMRVHESIVDPNATCTFFAPDGTPTRDVEATFVNSNVSRSYHLGAAGSLVYRQEYTRGIALVGRVTLVTVNNHLMGLFDFTDNTRRLTHGVENVHYDDALILSIIASVGVAFDLP